VETKRADVRQYTAVDEAVTSTVRRFGGLDILVNNAGVGVFEKVSEMTPVQWADVIDTNLTGVFNACHVALPHLRRRSGGFIINISSLAGANPFVGGAAYCASKAALNAFSEALMQEVRYDNIRVSYVMPGSVATGFAGAEDRAGRSGGSRHQSVAAQSAESAKPRRAAAFEAEEMKTPIFDKHRETLERHETMMGPARGRLAVALDLLTDSLALVGQHGVYCRSERFPGQPRMDIAMVLEQLDDAKQLVQSAMEELRRPPHAPPP
jgi:NAD(P)-dependent dehydrogenase (short-subunit alcohol dehydrogenase family)